MAKIIEYYSLKDYPNAKTISSQYDNTILINNFAGIPGSNGKLSNDELTYVDITFTSNCSWLNNNRQQFDFYLEYNNGSVSDINIHNYLIVWRKTPRKTFIFQTGETWRFYGHVIPIDSATPGVADPVNITNSALIKDGRVINKPIIHNGKIIFTIKKDGKEINLNK